MRVLVVSSNPFPIFVGAVTSSSSALIRFVVTSLSFAAITDAEHPRSPKFMRFPGAVARRVADLSAVKTFEFLDLDSRAIYAKALRSTALVQVVVTVCETSVTERDRERER